MEEGEEKKSHGLMLLFIMIFLPFQNRLLVHFTIIIHSADNEIERTRADEKKKEKKKKKKIKQIFSLVFHTKCS